MLVRVGLEDHPGYLGFTSAGVVLLHADWPVYPTEHGWLAALASLGSFPDRTAFSALDDIDRCLLLLADNHVANKVDPFSEKNFHVALWHEDILELVRRGLVHGAVGVTERVHELNHRRAIELDGLRHLIELLNDQMGEIKERLKTETEQPEKLKQSSAEGASRPRSRGDQARRRDS
jgi:hypothetical protein